MTPGRVEYTQKVQVIAGNEIGCVRAEVSFPVERKTARCCDVWIDDFRLLKEVENINEKQMLRVVKKTEDLLWNLRDKKIGILGLAFKPNTDDMRFAPSITIIEALEEEGATIKAYDPVATERAKMVMPDIEYCSSPYDVAQDVDAIVLVTEWDEFKKLDLRKIRDAMRQPVFVDGRNVFERDKMAELGFIYTGIGR